MRYIIFGTTSGFRYRPNYLSLILLNKPGFTCWWTKRIYRNKGQIDWIWEVLPWFCKYCFTDIIMFPSFCFHYKAALPLRRCLKSWLKCRVGEGGTKWKLITWSPQIDIGLIYSGRGTLIFFGWNPNIFVTLEPMQNFKINADNSGHLVPCSAHKPLWPKCSTIYNLNRHMSEQHDSFQRENVWQITTNKPFVCLVCDFFFF